MTAPKTTSSPLPKLLTAALLLLATPALAVGVRLSGHVTDPEGRPVAGAQVTVTAVVANINGGDEDSLRVKLKTDKKGRYRGVLLQSARTFRLEVVKEGFLPIEDKVELGLARADMNQPIEKNFTLEPGDAQVVVSSSPGADLYNQGVQAYRDKDLTTARARLEAALVEDPELAQAATALAAVCVDQGDFEAAAAAAEKALALEPSQPDALQLLYRSYRELGDERAEEVSQRLAQVDHSAMTPRRLYNQGVLAVRRGDFSSGAGLFEEALERDPDMSEAEEALAKAYAQAGDHRKAAIAAERILRRDSANVDALRIRQAAYAALGDREHERQALKDLVAHDRSPRTADLLYNAGVAAHSGGEYKEAVELFKEALAIDPLHLRARIGLADAALRSGDYREALAAASKVLEKQPNNPIALHVRDRAQQALADSSKP